MPFVVDINRICCTSHGPAGNGERWFAVLSNREFLAEGTAA
jgi:hypothetical protein